MAWNINELYTSDKVKTYQNDRIEGRLKRLEILNVNELVKQESNKKGVLGYKRGYVVAVYNESRGGSLILKRHFSNEKSAQAFAKRYMRTHN